MNGFELDQSNYSLTNVKEILYERLILAKQWSDLGDASKELSKGNRKYVENSFIPKQWKCKVKIEEWEDWR